MAALRYLPRSLFTLVVGVAGTVVAAVAAIVIARRDPLDPRIERVIDRWSRLWMWAAGVDLQIEGLENVERGRSYVVVANHASALDIMACFQAIPVPIRYLAKKELFRIPLLAPAMRAIGIIEVDRQARIPVHDQINSQTKELLVGGRSVIIYPEGTRSRNGELGSFKKGAFTIAARAGLPVLPVVIQGSHQAWPPGSLLIRGGTIRVVIEPPIETTGPNRIGSDELRDAARRVIGQRLVATAQS